ncbi:SRPBCC family protein [Saccharopolyspora sp. NPDC050389]|uniref:SRPBCC family protein n=1 Tax=Saccharopolyspora sp. NPDC050389 TaxID=3155516 RepID=UPI0033FAAF9E
MAIRNLHVRRLPVDEDAAGALIDSLASPHDELWPHDRWPAMRFDRPLGVGATGGHGPIRYQVVAYVPGRWIRFRFTAPRGFDGIHEFTVHRESDGTSLHHLLSMHARGPARITWPILWRPLHDAALEDSLDRAERNTTGTVRAPARWSWLVRLLVSVGSRRFRRVVHEPVQRVPRTR